MIAASACPACGTTLVSSDRVCGKCGSGIVRCDTCSAIVAIGDRYCAVCGSNLPTTSDRVAVDARSSGSTSADNANATAAWDGILERLRQATLGEYEVLHEIGRGGMAAVYLAQEIALNRRVAIKVMAPGMMVNQQMVARFRQEAVTVANLAHANIVTIHTVREVDDLHFFVMKFIAGRPLDRVLAGIAGPLPVPVAREILAQVGSGLAYAHRRGVIHRDVKPANILLDGEGQAMVTDFGIAKVIESPNRTLTGGVFGTPAYMSPEQCYAAPLGASSDQYSLGIVAYEMLAGRRPWLEMSAFALMQAHTTLPVPSLGDVGVDCPPDLEAAVLRMLAKKPADRWPTMAAALAALQAYPARPGDPVLDELVRLADVDAIVSIGDVLRAPASPVPRSRPPTPPRPAVAETPPLVAPEPPRVANSAPAAGLPLRKDLRRGRRIPMWAVVVGVTVTIAGAALVNALRRRDPISPRVTLVVSRAPESVRVGDTFLLTASVRPVGTSHGAVRWRASTTAVTVDAVTGQVVARSAGHAVVIAYNGTVSDSSVFDVIPESPAPKRKS